MLPAIFQCDAFWNMTQEVEADSIQVSDESKDSLRGTELHTANETGEIDDLDESGQELIERTRSIEEQITLDWLAETGHTLADIEIIREKRFWVGNHFSAQVDFLAINRGADSCLVADLKSGRRKVSPPIRNFQLRGCIVAVQEQYGFKSIRTAIVQPMAARQSVCDYTSDQISVARRIIIDRLNFVRYTQGLKPKSGDACAFCRGLPICPEGRRNMSVAVRGVNLKWSLATADEKVALFRASKIAEVCAKRIVALCRAELKENPEAIKGLSLAPDQHPRKITDPATLMEMMHAVAQIEKGGKADEDFARKFIELGKFSVSDVIGFYREQTGLSKAEAEKFINDRIGICVEQGTKSGPLSVSEEET